MKTKHFFNSLDHARITEAIKAAELCTSGEIRVFVARRPSHDPVRAAQAEFLKLRMDATKERNAVLVYVAPKSQTFAIIGDKGVHEKCGQDFWSQVAQAMRSHFTAGHHTDAIVHGIQEAGALLSEHFPRQSDDKNELSDEVID